MYIHINVIVRNVYLSCNCGYTWRFKAECRGKAKSNCKNSSFVEFPVLVYISFHAGAYDAFGFCFTLVLLFGFYLSLILSQKPG